MSGDLIARRHERSGRTAIVADEGDSVWLYLTAPRERRIAADCWLLNRIPAPSGDVLRSRLDHYRSQAVPPPAPAEEVGPGALRASALSAADVDLTWSQDGEAVAAWVDGQPVGYLAAGDRRGHSRHLSVAGRWGAAWDEAEFRRLFPPTVA